MWLPFYADLTADVEVWHVFKRQIQSVFQVFVLENCSSFHFFFCKVLGYYVSMCHSMSNLSAYSFKIMQIRTLSNLRACSSVPWLRVYYSEVGPIYYVFYAYKIMSVNASPIPLLVASLVMRFYFFCGNLPRTIVLFLFSSYFILSFFPSGSSCSWKQYFYF